MAPQKKVELLAPAGNFEKLEVAIHYGADAVYVGGKNFSLRNFSGNFSEKELDEAIKFAHDRNVKIFVACNIYPRNHEISFLKEHLGRLAKMAPDAIIVADPGVFMLAKTEAPSIDIHLSTQANTTHIESVRFWQQIGAKRVNLARELSLKEIRTISECCNIEIEAFVHGAMCISYSGRCLLSSFMTMRDSNRGMCSHPCRWNYTVMEQSRKDEYFPIAEDKRGTYVFNSKDLCMIDHIPEMLKSGIDSLKIEGRMKGIHYLASVVKVYREALDTFYSAPDAYHVKAWWKKELRKVGFRDYCTGFYFGNPSDIVPFYDADQSVNHQLFVGKIIRSINGTKALVEVRNKLFKGESVELLTPKGPPREDVILDMVSADGKKPDFAQPGNLVTIDFKGKCGANDLLRKKGNPAV
ncbi:MAG: U32 family peptidase [Desulfobacterales bacterium]